MPTERVFVAATSIETGRFAPSERPVDREDLLRMVDQLSAGDQGYVEVRRMDKDFPALLIGFRKGLAVVQRMLDRDRWLCLRETVR